MIRIAVAVRAGAAPATPLAAQFGPEGGTIGRAESNTLVLDDPERTVSRLHAQVLQRDGRFVLVDRGSNPMQHNGRSLGAGQEVMLSHGDRLLVGSFELVVEYLADKLGSAGSQLAPDAASLGAGLTDDPFANLLEGLAPPPAPVVPTPASAAPDQLPFPDPLGLDQHGAAASTAQGPLGDFMVPGAVGGPAGPDDFSDLVAHSSGAAAPIDALFDLGGGIGGDPLAMGPLGDPLTQPNTAGAADPLLALQGSVRTSPAARPDHVPIGEFGFKPPQAMPPVTPAVPPPPPPPPPAAPPGSGDLEFFDADLSDLSGPAMEVPDSVGTASPGTPTSTPSPDQAAARPAERVQVDFEFSPPAGPRVRGDQIVRPAAQSAPLTEPSAARPPQPGDAELLAALLRGLGALQQPPATLTPALMERIGRMLRISTEGTLQLLLTRQELKREVRAQVTVIASQANNPLKFSPTVEVALAHLLGPGMQGFMPAEAAVRDAYQDLRAHEFGVMVGMRAALAHVIERFAPAALERNMAARSKLDSVFSASRKARLWEQFLALYDGIAKEAEDDFHSLFGKAFLQAYEEQLARLAAAERDADAE